MLPLSVIMLHLYLGIHIKHVLTMKIAIASRENIHVTKLVNGDITRLTQTLSTQHKEG